MSPFPCDPFVVDLSQVRVGADRDTVAHEKFIAVRAFAKHNFFYRAQSPQRRRLALSMSLVFAHFVFARSERPTNSL
jgi:hypothetical protein